MILDIEENILKSDEDAIRLQVLESDMVPLNDIIIDGDKFIIDRDKYSSAININSEQSRDFFMKYCKEIKCIDTISIRTSVDMDFSTFPKVSYRLNEQDFGTVNINVKSHEKINLTNISQKSFGLSKPNSMLSINGYHSRPEVSLKGMYWDGHSVMLGKVKLHDVNKGCFARDTELVTISDVEPGERLDAYANQQLLKYFLYQDEKVRSIGIEITDDAIDVSEEGVVKLLQPGFYTCVMNIPLSNFGVKKIKAQKSNTISISVKNAHCVDGAEKVYISGYGQMSVDNSKSGVKNQTYVITTDFLHNARVCDLNLVCDTENDKDIEHTSDYENCSYLRFNRGVVVADWNNIKCNCRELFVNESDPIVVKIIRLARYNEIKDSDVNEIIPLNNFSNLKYITWSTVNGFIDGIYRKDGRWYWFDE